MARPPVPDGRGRRFRGCGHFSERLLTSTFWVSCFDFRPWWLKTTPEWARAISRAPRLFDELALAKADGRYLKILASYARIDPLVIGDWGLANLTEEQRRDILEIMEDRHGLRSTLIASQLLIEKWHKVIGAPTLADAILDRLVHNAHKLALKGDSLRKEGKKSQE